MVTFNEIPPNNRSPASFVELDPRGGGASTPERHDVIIGTRLTTGTVAALTPTEATGETEADGLHGIGSQIAETYRAYRALNRASRVTLIAVDEPTGVAASGTITITGPATADGLLAVYVAGIRVEAEVADEDTATDVGDALEAAINANTRLPVTASNAAGVVTITARWKGLTGNEIDLATNLRTTDELPAGIAAAIAAMGSGTGTPDLSTLVAVLEETRYSTFVTPFHDDTSLTTLEQEVERRWEADVALDGHVLTAAAGTHGELTTIGGQHNSPASTIFGIGGSPSAPWIAAAQVTAREANATGGKWPPFGASLPDVLAPDPSDRFDHAERNLLLSAGVSTYRVDAGGTMTIDRLITTFQKDDFGNPDTVWLALTTRRVLAFLRFDWVARTASKYGGYKLADDGTRVDPGVQVVTPSVLRGEALAWYQQHERAGLVEDFEGFRERLVSERPDGQPERVDMLHPIDITNDLITLATLFGFRV